MDLRLGKESCMDDDICLPGCRCPLNQFEYLGSCVPLRKCPCYDREANTVLNNFEPNWSPSCQKW